MTHHDPSPLSQHIKNTHTIKCSKCGAAQMEHNITERTFLMILEREGWKVKWNKPYCKECR